MVTLLRDFKMIKQENEKARQEKEEANRYLCERGGHQLKLINTTTYGPGYASCNKCGLDITKDQIAAGYYNCALDQSDYHKECLDPDEPKEEIKKNDNPEKIVAQKRSFVPDMISKYLVTPALSDHKIAESVSLNQSESRLKNLVKEVNLK